MRPWSDRYLFSAFNASQRLSTLFNAIKRLSTPALLAVLWWLTIRPSNARDWQTEVAQAPYAEIEGDRVVIHNFRNFDYVTKTDFRPRWETKTVHLSNLRAVDFFTNYWGSTLICHTFLSFDFGPEGYVCISIETRMMKGQAYSPIAGLPTVRPLLRHRRRARHRAGAHQLPA